MSGSGRDKARRQYRPAVEALEALKLLDAAPALFPEVVPAEVSPSATRPASTVLASDASSHAWDAALGQTQLFDLLAPNDPPDDVAPADINAGLAQLDKYLARTWYRAGVAPQKQDDCTQAVYVTLLQGLGRARFDGLVGDIGRSGIRDVLSRETAEGPDFFRAIDTIKKRAQRERTYQPLDQVASTSAATTDPAGTSDWRDALREAMTQSLSARESDLIDSTLKGETPAEIAARWGVAPKTVSNEKTRAIQKLRDALVADLVD